MTDKNHVGTEQNQLTENKKDRQKTEHGGNLHQAF